MKHYTINKAVGNPQALRSALLLNGCAEAALIVGAQPAPYVLVDVGDADPDPTSCVNTYVDPPRIEASSNKPVGPFGHAQANADGVDTQVITVQTYDAVTQQPTPWNGNVIIQPMAPILISASTIAIVNGVGTFTVGPTSMPSECDIWIQLQSDTVGYTRYRLHLNFF